MVVVFLVFVFLVVGGGGLVFVEHVDVVAYVVAVVVPNGNDGREPIAWETNGAIR